MILTKTELAKQLSKETRFKPMTIKTATDIIETLADLIVCHFQSGGRTVAIRGFGTFKLKTRKAFIGSHPRDQTRIAVAEKCSLSFKPGAEVIRRLNNK